MPSSPISPCPVVPAPRGGRTWLRGVLVVGDRRTVGDPRTAVACAGQHGRPRRTTREALPPCDSGRHPVHRGGMRQLPVEFPPAGTVYAVFARWARSGAWQRILDALRDRLRVRAGRDRCPTAAIIDSQTVPAAAHRAPIQPRLGWRQENERRQAAPRRGCERPAARRRRHRRLDPGPRRRTPTPGRTARQLLHHPAGLGRRRLLRTVAHLGERRSHPYYADHQTHPRRRWFPRPAPHLDGREKFRVGSTSTAAARATTKPDPTTTKPWSTSP